MPTTGLLMLLDDIASSLDDIALMTKTAAMRTAAVVGDDIAVTANLMDTTAAEREWSIIWAIAKGSLKNKLLLVPSILAITVLKPWALLPILGLGGLYLCYEGAEKLMHAVFGQRGRSHAQGDPPGNARLAISEKDKIDGAIRTDLVLSAEIILIALNSLPPVSLSSKFLVLLSIAIIMNVVIYGLVALIIKIDDVGFYLMKRSVNAPMETVLKLSGRLLLESAPWIMRALGVLGTAALFMVGGGIINHTLETLHLLPNRLLDPLNQLTVGMPLNDSTKTLFVQAILGVVMGSALVITKKVASKTRTLLT